MADRVYHGLIRAKYLPKQEIFWEGIVMAYELVFL